MAILLFISILLIAACGLIYELIAGAVASYLVGDSVFQFSTVIGSYLFAFAENNPVTGDREAGFGRAAHLPKLRESSASGYEYHPEGGQFRGEGDFVGSGRGSGSSETFADFDSPRRSDGSDNGGLFEIAIGNRFVGHIVALDREPALDRPEVLIGSVVFDCLELHALASFR